MAKAGLRSGGLTDVKSHLIYIRKNLYLQQFYVYLHIPGHRLFPCGPGRSLTYCQPCRSWLPDQLHNAQTPFRSAVALCTSGVGYSRRMLAKCNYLQQHHKKRPRSVGAPFQDESLLATGTLRQHFDNTFPPKGTTHY